MLQSLFGYDATHAGLVMSPSGIFAIAMLPIIGFLLGKQVDARWLILVGLLLVSGGCYWMSTMNLEISPGQVVWPRVVQTLGTSVLFAPLSVAAYMYLPNEWRGSAVGLFSLLRNEGGSVGTSVARTLLQRREQFHSLRLGEQLDPFNPAVVTSLRQAREFFLAQTGDPARADQMALQLLANVRDEQGAALSYFDCFWAFSMLALMLTPLVFLMRRSVSEKGAHVAAE